MTICRCTNEGCNKKGGQAFPFAKDQGVPKTQGFLFKMQPVLENHLGLFGTKGGLNCGTFLAKLGKVPGNPRWVGHPGEKGANWCYIRETEPMQLGCLG